MASTRELIIDTDEYADLFVEFEACAAFVRTRFGAGILAPVDERDELDGDTGSRTGTGG
ncbi:MAG: hypothetical protein ACRDWD_16870 [Acidimicrobiia bacterium]